MCEECTHYYEHEYNETQRLDEQLVKFDGGPELRRPPYMHYGGYFFSIKHAISGQGSTWPLPLDDGPIDEEYWIKEGWVRGPKTQEADYRT